MRRSSVIFQLSSFLVYNIFLESVWANSLYKFVWTTSGLILNIGNGPERVSETHSKHTGIVAPHNIRHRKIMYLFGWKFISFVSGKLQLIVSKPVPGTGKQSNFLRSINPLCTNREKLLLLPRVPSSTHLRFLSTKSRYGNSLH